MSNKLPTAQPDIELLIYNIRGQQVMLDRDLAILYGVETKALNQAVKRNIERFPLRYRFQLTEEETRELVTNCDRLKTLKHSTVLPYVYTEQGISMLSTVLRTETAIAVSIRIIDTFVATRRILLSNVQVFQRLENFECQQLSLQHHQEEADRRINEVFQRLEEREAKPNCGIFYDGQIFDAYTFVCERVKEAQKSIILIDNYVDESTLTLLDKRNRYVTATIYTKNISRQLQLDMARHNSQYEPIAVNAISNVHDRFLIIDDAIYLIGASIKDVGKKVFGFARITTITLPELLGKLK